MFRIFYFFLYALLFSCSLTYGQKKTLQTKITSEKITIDGRIDEESWKTADIATDFFMIMPDNGVPVSNSKRSEVKVVYDNDAIYIAAKLFDDEPNKISKELTTRDDFANADHFAVLLNGYNDGQQEYRFFVSASGVQLDILYTEATGEDYSWDAIWDSKVEITNFGWVVEMRIPYAALRFSSEKKQTWGLNFYREIRRDRQQFSWSLLDNKISSESNQAGILEGIENIQTPTRLFLIPFSSFYLNSSKAQKTTGELKGGLDVKYGINDAFTLDAILIPDFGQTKFDNVELNLSAFEQQFNENRPFFTEGTELFNKGDLVYSRRIGGSASTYPTLADNEFIEDFPSNIKLINALKVSGRTKNGLGIGVLNAVTEKTSVLIKSTEGNLDRLETIEPLTNYNVLVLDQRFSTNSSVSLVNTNVNRNGEFRDANVSALVFDLNTKKNTYNFSGDYKYSFVNEYGNLDNKKGYNTSLNLGETSGKYRYQIGGQYVSESFDNNDLGINFQTHYHSIYANSSYRILKPNKRYNSYRIDFNNYVEFDNRTGKIQVANISLDFNTNDRKNDYWAYGIDIRPVEVHDFYEPRSADDSKYLINPEFISGFFLFSSNYNRKFAIDIKPTFAVINEKDRMNYGLVFAPRFRFSDKFSLNHSFSFSRQNNNIGWVDFDADDNTIFARRTRITYINTLNGKFSVNNKMNFNLALRHYWSYAINHDYLTLQDNGKLIDNLDYATNKNSNLNTWNLDLSYSWWFAPGSQISILYRNNAALFTREFSRELDTNLKNAVDAQNLSHVFSISIRYFIDYNTLKN